MSVSLPKIGEPLSAEQLDFLHTFSKSCRRSILEMVTNAQSGHPGGSLSAIDYLSVLYAFVLGKTGEKLVVSNGHISPAVYGVLAEMGYIDKKDVVANFRKFGTKYEGHITRHVTGIEFGTGPLGVGVSVGAGFAFAEKLRETGKKVYGIMGDGEVDEGQVHEMIHFCKNYNLDNYVLFVDYNKVQLTASLEEVMDIDIRAIFEAGDWQVIEINGHSMEEIWQALSIADSAGKPVCILGNTIMGKGVEFMEDDGALFVPTWHGKAPKPDQTKEALKQLSLTTDEEKLLEEFRKTVSWKPKPAKYTHLLEEMKIKTGDPILYGTDELVDSRTAYGKALLDLAKNNKNILALTADVKTSVMTKFVSAELPEQYIECGIAEQHMMSLAGGLSVDDYIPFVSTFGAFLSSRAKDQARVNDINNCNVKMVATHCGLSVGEDGPTHQAIDDMGSFLGFFNTMICEPADPNQCDRIIRYIASHYGNFYVRMGRHKYPVITKVDGTPFYDKDYKYEYGKTDVIREGVHLTLVATGAMVHEALEALDQLPEGAVELIAVSSIKQFDHTLLNSVMKTRKVITVEDHNVLSGLGSQVARHLQEEGVGVDLFKTLGVREYQLSGKSPELYENAGISAGEIARVCKMIV